MLLVLLAVQVVLLSIGDRVAAHVAAAQMASQIQKSAHLPSRPQTSIGGVPFLTQVAFGKYDDVGLGIRRIKVSGVCVDDIDVHAKGAHVPFRTVVGNDVTTVPIDRVVGSVHLTYADLNAYLAAKPGRVQLAPAGTGLRVSAPVTVPVVGQVRVFGDVRASVDDNRLTLAPAGVGVAGLGAFSIPSGAVRTLTVTVPVSGLPLNLQLRSAKATPDGIVVTAEADHLTLNAKTTTTPQIQAC